MASEGNHAIVVGSEDARRVLREKVKPSADVLVLGARFGGARRYTVIDLFTRPRNEAARRWVAGICAVDATVRTWV